MINEIEKKLKQCFNEMGFSTAEITDNANLSKDLGLDSLDITDLILRLESEFCITVPDTDMGKLQTIGGIKNYLLEELAVVA